MPNNRKSARLMYVENKHGDIDGAQARIGWVTLSKSGRSIYYRGRTLLRATGTRGNHICLETREEYWVSGVKKRGSNTHPHESVSVKVDADAKEAYLELKTDRR